MAKTKPTRSELIKLKRQIKLAQSGHSLLKRKRDGLIKEFFNVLNKAKQNKSVLDECYRKAVSSIDLARAVEGTLSIKSTAFSLVQKSDVDVKTKAVMGVNVPEIKSDYNVKQFHERGYGIIGTSAYIDDAAEKYETVIKNVLVSAEIETTLKKLLVEIDKTKRRVNALEFVVIPRMKSEAKFITLRLEEMEREDVFRLKKIKGKKKKK